MKPNTEYFETIGKTNNLVKAVEENRSKIKLCKKVILRQFEYFCYL